MWPLTGLDVVRACGADEALPDALASVILGGVSVGDRPPARDELYVALREGGFDGHDGVEAALAAGAPLALVASDWSGRSALEGDHQSRCVVVEDTLVAFRRLAALLRGRFSFPVVAVGGSNGKTTTKDMIGALLSGPGRLVTMTPETMNGWTGLPVTLTQRAHAAARPPDALVVEIGIDAVGAMREHAHLVDPDVATITALGPEHLAGLGSEETALREELELFDASPRVRRVFFAGDARIAEELSRAREGDVIVCAASEAIEHARRGHAVLGYVATSAGAASSEVELTWRPAATRPERDGGDEPDAGPAWRRSFVVPMPGRHNVDDFAIAAATAIALGRTEGDLALGWASFAPPPMRCELRALPGGGVLVDDAYNASPSSVAVALELLDIEEWRGRHKIVVLGDMLDLGASTERHHLALPDRLAALAGGGAQICLYGAAMQSVHRELGSRGIASSHLHVSADPAAFLDDGALRLDGALVLVKGSRGMQLERFVAALERPNATEDDLRSLAPLFRTVCVTGTNGKTTTSSLVAAIVAAAGETPCRVTTIGAWVGGEMTGAAPTGNAFLRTIERARERGVRTLAIETTSHALADGFARSWPPHVGVFTNLSRDHLDHHGTPEGYLAAKAQLFMSLSEGGVAVLNVADPASALLDEVTPRGVRRLGYASRAPDPACAAIPIALRAEEIVVDDRGTHARLAPSPIADALGGRLDLALVGDVHVDNALAAALAAHAVGYDAGAIRAAFASFGGVPGRFEIVHRAPLVVVDYAHTPDALERTLGVARRLVAGAGGRVMCVFGCGGERDPGKRSEMGAVASRIADVVVITSDNPRSEDPEAIADAIVSGASEGNARLLRLPDRREAIGCAVELAGGVDIVVIAGKGHEKTQTIGDRELPFDDVEVAREAAAQRRGDTGG